jgi:hypothetical protein
MILRCYLYRRNPAKCVFFRLFLQLYWTVCRTLLSMEKPLPHGSRAPMPKRRNVCCHASVATFSARIFVPVSAGIHRVPVRDTHIERVRLEAMPKRWHVLAAQHQGTSVQLCSRVYRYAYYDIVSSINTVF